MPDDKPITKKEALKYDRQALENDVQRRRRNIKLFQEQINKQGFENDVARREMNIQLFQNQINQEEKEIEKLWQIIAIIDANKK